MSMKHEPAFPVPGSWEMHGISVRDYFAAAAMQGMLATGDYIADEPEMAKYAYGYADAMLTARDQSEPPVERPVEQDEFEEECDE